MTPVIFNNLKDISITLGILGAITGAAVNSGKQHQEIKNTKEVVAEVKVELKEKRDIDLEQTIAIKEIAVIQKTTVKLLDRLEEKLK